MDAKKAMILTAVALVLFYTITQPTQVAEAVQGLLGWLGDGAATIVGFFRRLFG
jgi:hypothetical protein